MWRPTRKRKTSTRRVLMGRPHASMRRCPPRFSPSASPIEKPATLDNRKLMTMTGRKNHARTHDEALHEYRMHEQVERGEKVAGTEADWLDRRGPAARAGQRADAITRHSHIRRSC